MRDEEGETRASPCVYGMISLFYIRVTKEEWCVQSGLGHTEEMPAQWCHGKGMRRLGAGCPGEREPWEALPLSPLWTLCVLRDVKAGVQKTQGQMLMEASTLNTNICCCVEGTLSLTRSF